MKVKVVTVVLEGLRYRPKLLPVLHPDCECDECAEERALRRAEEHLRERMRMA